MAMRNYGIDRVELSWFGLDLKPGLAAGSSITETRTTQSFSLLPGGMGSVTRTYNPDRSGSVAILVDQTSQTHKDLMVLSQVDRATRGVVGVMTLKDISSDETIYYKNACIASDPPTVRGSVAGTYTWVFLFETAEYQGGNANANVVGS